MRASCCLFLLALAPPAQAASLFSGDHPAVEEGNRAYADGKFDEALKAYERAERELPQSAELQFNRGSALFKLGRPDEAREAFARALATPDEKLRARDYYNMGDALAKLGRDADAIAAFRRALQIDPKDADALHNLQVLLLRRDQKPPQQDGGSDGGSDGGRDAGQDAGRDGGSDGGQAKPDGGQDGGGDAGQEGGRDGGRDGGGQSGADGGRDAGQDGGQGPSRGDSAGDGGMDGGAADGGPRPISKQEAERILDSLRRNEKNFQMWQLRGKQRARGDVEKDW